MKYLAFGSRIDAPALDNLQLVTHSERIAVENIKRFDQWKIVALDGEKRWLVAAGRGRLTAGMTYAQVMNAWLGRGLIEDAG